MIIAEFAITGKDRPGQTPWNRCRPKLYHCASAGLLALPPHGENVFVDNALIN
jgi:hypothetical protein